ncbi:MAG: VOC family protein [Chloroflexota bacterium]|nr:VOC family protein [Chloroflexota bacterium]
MKLGHVEHIDMVVKDINRSVEYYKKFGLVVEGTLDKGKTVFLGNKDSRRPLVLELHQAEEGQKTGLDHIALYVDDVGAAYDELVRNGIAFTLKPQHGTASGRVIAVTEDPDGIRIQLAKKTTRGEYEDFK